MAEGPVRRRLAGAPDEGAEVLALGRRPHQRRDPEAAGLRLEQAPVTAPDEVIERTLDVTRHDRVALSTGHGARLGGLLGVCAPGLEPAERMNAAIVHTRA